jgi:transcription initiation factor TFIIIB Brf1 subunit/transcription initiation factor TFIIB
MTTTMTRDCPDCGASNRSHTGTYCHDCGTVLNPRVDPSLRTWREDDRVRKGDDVGTVTELFRSGSLVHRLVVQWDGGGETLENPSAVAWDPTA